MKKISVLITFTVAVLIFVFGNIHVKKSELFKPYPDVVYIPENMAKTRVAYQNLSEREKAVYTALYRGISQKSEYIELPFEIDGGTYEKIYFNIEKQEPELFWLAGDFYSAEKIRTAQIIYRNVSDEMKLSLETVKNQILDDIKNYDNYGKLLYIHDYLTENCKYIESGVENIDNAYGCLVDKNANCEGYSKAFKYLCDGSNIPCVVTVGKSFDGTNHAWNQVQLGGNWYNVDVTWDDCDDEFVKVHAYFLCSDSDFVLHIPDSELMPVFECKENSQNYYIRNNAFIANQNDAERILAEKLGSFSENIELKFSDNYTYNEFKNVYIENQRIFDIFTENNPDVANNKINCLMKDFENNCIITFKIQLTKSE